MGQLPHEAIFYWGVFAELFYSTRKLEVELRLSPNLKKVEFSKGAHFV